MQGINEIDQGIDIDDAADEAAVKEMALLGEVGVIIKNLRGLDSPKNKTEERIKARARKSFSDRLRVLLLELGLPVACSNTLYVAVPACDEDTLLVMDVTPQVGGTGPGLLRVKS